jgi:2-beta-glucuronyltransferase
MRRRGSIQSIADAFKRAGFRTVFLSLRFSALSMLKEDPRMFLAGRANRLEVDNGIECYLWRTPIHPFASRHQAVNHVTGPLHALSARWPNRAVDALFAAADVVMVESGMGVVFIPRIRGLNPRGLILYRGSDALDTIGAHPELQRRLEAAGPDVDHFCLLARGMAPQFAFARTRTYVVGQGVEPGDFEAIGPSPYPPGACNAVCAGAMLFDPSVFEAAAPALPDVTFHLIGCGPAAAACGPNVRVYPEMPFRDLRPYLAHADFGVAPYRSAPAARYLAESSLKLTQFAYLRRPAVCPDFAAGAYPHRFGYVPGDARSIVDAMRRARAHRFDAEAAAPPTWDALVPRFLRPWDFQEARLAEHDFAVSAG